MRAVGGMGHSRLRAVMELRRGGCQSWFLLAIEPDARLTLMRKGGARLWFAVYVHILAW